MLYQCCLQAAATSVDFLTGSHVLASAGLDEQLMLLDRRSNSVAASVGAKMPLHSMACRDDGTTIAVGTSGGGDVNQMSTDKMLAACQISLIKEEVSHSNWRCLE